MLFLLYIIIQNMFWDAFFIIYYNKIYTLEANGINELPILTSFTYSSKGGKSFSGCAIKIAFEQDWLLSSPITVSVLYLDFLKTYYKYSWKIIQSFLKLFSMSMLWQHIKNILIKQHFHDKTITIFNMRCIGMRCINMRCI